MFGFIRFVMVVGAGVLLHRVLYFISAAKKAHRERLRKEGWVENNPGRRERGERYLRIAVISYTALGGFLYVFGGRIFDTAVPWQQMAMAVVLPIPVAVIVWLGLLVWTEAWHPWGDLFLTVRDKTFHRLPQQLANDSSKGSARLETPEGIGLSNPFAWTTSRQPIVEKEVAR